MDTVLQYTVAAAATASIYSLISVGITMIYGVARLMNVAHAMMFLLAAFVTAELVGRGWLYAPAAVAAIVLVTAIGTVIYFVVFDRVRDRPFSSLIVSLGLVVVADAVLHLIWGIDVYRIRGLLSQAHSVGGVSFTTGGVVTIAVTLAIVATLTVVFRRTAAGRVLRAVAENPQMATILGVKARSVTAIVFVAGTAMAALAGALVGTFVPFSTSSAGTFVLKAFAIAIVGGLGSPLGALAASALFATAEIVPIATGHAQWSTSVLFLTLIAVLLLRPQGLFGRRTPAGAHDDGLQRLDSEHRQSSRRRRTMFALVAAALFAAPLLTSNRSTEGLLAYSMGLVVLAFSVWVPLRFLGVPSLGHAALFGSGAYIAAIAMKDGDLSLGYQIVLAMVGGAVFALLMAVIAMRVSGLSSIAIITLALGGFLVTLLSNLVSITGGVSGLTATKPLRLANTTYAPADSDIALYYLGFAMVLISLGVGLWLTRSRSGKALMAIRDSQILAEALGYNTYLAKVVVFGLSGAGAGLAGVLFVYYGRYLEPNMFGDTLAINVLLAVLLGGATSLYGPVVGVLLYVFLPDLLPFSSAANQMVYGLFLVGIAIVSPGGMTSWPTQIRRSIAALARSARRRVEAATSHA